MLTSTKPNKCRHCKVRMPEDKAKHVLHDECFQPWLTKQLAKQAAAREKKDRAEFRERKERAKRTSKWEEECRTIVQAIARIRDKDDGCISCHMPANYGGAWHGSHFRSHGAASAVQFHLWNIHKACAQCNLFKSGNIAAYRPRLVEKIGQEKVDWLMSQNQIVRHSVEYYKRFKRVMSKRLRRLEKRTKGNVE